MNRLRRIFDRLSGGSRSIAADPLRSPILESYYVAQSIAGAINDRRAYLAARLGWLECYALGMFEKDKSLEVSVLKKLRCHAGVFPVQQDEFQRFYTTYTGALGSVDMLGLMEIPHEQELISRHAPQALLCNLGALEPYLCSYPWSRHLEGCRVLVVHPFVESIQQQFHLHRSRLFANPDVLPEFDLLCMKPPQSMVENTGEFASWTEGLEDLKQRISRVDFDVALIGCGAYGLPTGAFVKSLGKVAVHMGGATQLLFGISGSRWRTQPVFRSLMTDAWNPPLKSEHPPGWEKIENGCYW